MINSICEGESRFPVRCGPWQVNPVPVKNHMSKRERAAQIGLGFTTKMKTHNWIGEGGMRIDRKGAARRSDIYSKYLCESLQQYFKIKI